MVRYQCDYCQALKESGETWILGFAAENVGVNAARREITIAPRWDESRAVDYLAVHFCSDACRRKYMGRLFGGEPPEPAVVEEVAVVPKKRVVRIFPGAKVETVAKRRTIRARTTKTRRKRA
jgi:hypothetical protein